jgi:hypothetical protein
MNIFKGSLDDEPAEDDTARKAALAVNQRTAEDVILIAEAVLGQALQELRQHSRGSEWPQIVRKSKRGNESKARIEEFLEGRVRSCIQFSTEAHAHEVACRVQMQPPSADGTGRSPLHDASAVYLPETFREWLEAEVQQCMKKWKERVTPTN